MGKAIKLIVDPAPEEIALDVNNKPELLLFILRLIAAILAGCLRLGPDNSFHVAFGEGLGEEDVYAKSVELLAALSMTALVLKGCAENYQGAMIKIRRIERDIIQHGVSAKNGSCMFSPFQGNAEMLEKYMSGRGFPSLTLDQYWRKVGKEQCILPAAGVVKAVRGVAESRGRPSIESLSLSFPYSMNSVNGFLHKFNPLVATTGEGMWLYYTAGKINTLEEVTDYLLFCERKRRDGENPPTYAVWKANRDLDLDVAILSDPSDEDEVMEDVSDKPIVEDSTKSVDGKMCVWCHFHTPVEMCIEGEDGWSCKFCWDSYFQ